MEKFAKLGLQQWQPFEDGHIFCQEKYTNLLPQETFDISHDFPFDGNDMD